MNSKLNNIVSDIILEFLNEQEPSNNNFKKWFGSSKIIENGKPMICYHGSPDPSIKVFDISKIGTSSGNYGHYGYGIYFSTDIREAKIYGDNIYKCYLKITNPFIGTDDQILQLKSEGIDTVDDLDVLSIDFKSFKESFRNNGLVYEFIDNIEKRGSEYAWDTINKLKDDNINYDMFSDITDIIDYTTLNKNVHGVPEYIFDDLKQYNVKPKLNKGFNYKQSLHWITDLGNRSKDVTNIMKKLGYDGVYYGSEIVVFYPNQIKSINNDGSWDINDNNIYS